MFSGMVVFMGKILSRAVKTTVVAAVRTLTRRPSELHA
jgi:hypothetical protein